MAKPICELLDRVEGKQARKCDSGCKYYMFDHLDTPCVLSDVYSVAKNKLCYIYKVKLDKQS